MAHPTDRAGHEPSPKGLGHSVTIPCALLPGDLVQIVNEGHHWFPAIVVVSESKSFGIQGFVFMPTNDDSGTGEAYIRLRFKDFEALGANVIVGAPDLFDDRAQAIEAQRAATLGAVEDESAVLKGCAQ